MVKNLWNDVILMCGNNHTEPQRMCLASYGTKMFYACPACENNVQCKNKISILQYEKMIDHLSKVITDAAINGEEVNLTDYKWKNKNIYYHVQSYSPKLIIDVLNKEELIK